MKKWGLEIAVFICGAVVMILELVGSRILAPYVGTSVVVWTSLIGVILAALSAGYYSGGRLADAHASPKEFTRLIFFGGILILYTAVAKTAILTGIAALVHLIHPAAVLGATLLFAPASVVLGMISPYAVKLRMREVAQSGTTAGTLSALSTIGSIAGTFLAGYFLIAYFGSTNILYILACILLSLALLLEGTLSAGGAAWLAIAIVYAWSSTRSVQAEKNLGHVEMDTPYQHVSIYPVVWNDGRRVRLLRTDAFGAESGMYLDGNIAEPVFEYLKMFDLVDHFHPRLTGALMIGGAAYTYPKTFLSRYPKANLDVAEIDPDLTKLAVKYFSLKESPRLHVHHEDARTFINRLPNGAYDAVFVDAFSSLTPPPQLTTLEAARKIRDGLTGDGVVLMNIVSAFEGDNGRFFRAEYATYKKVFPLVYAFKVQKDDTPNQVQNILLVASKNTASDTLQDGDPELQEKLGRLWRKVVPTDMPPLTDEYAPVERYSMGMYRAIP